MIGDGRRSSTRAGGLANGPGPIGWLRPGNGQATGDINKSENLSRIMLINRTSGYIIGIDR